MLPDVVGIAQQLSERLHIHGPIARRAQLARLGAEFARALVSANSNLKSRALPFPFKLLVQLLMRLDAKPRPTAERLELARARIFDTVACAVNKLYATLHVVFAKAVEDLRRCPRIHR